MQTTAQCAQPQYKVGTIVMSCGVPCCIPALNEIDNINILLRNYKCCCVNNIVLDFIITVACTLWV